VGVLLAIGGILLTLLLFFILSRSIISPFRELTRVMKKVQKGNLNSRVTIKSKGELGQLGYSLNTMITQLNNLINREYKAKIDLQNAEFKALQSQIQPHFLYNTMSGLLGLNRMKDHEGLEKAILSLSKMLRYILEHKDKTSVKEEFQFLEQYCHLQQLRFEEKMNFQINYEPGTESLTIPKLLIQPLVENAIIHGIEPADRLCQLFINAKFLHSCSYLHISVTDTGVGFNSSANTTEENIGIANIRRRIESTFSEGAGLKVVSTLNVGTTSSIKIPIKDVIRYENSNI
jgi:two-component system, sensor histidine kinase YesM